MHGGNIYSLAARNKTNPDNILDFSANMNDFIEVHDINLNSVEISNYPEIDLEYYKKILAADEFNYKSIMIVPGITYFIHRYLSMVRGNIIMITPVFTEYTKIMNDGDRIFMPFNVIERDVNILKNYNFKILIFVYPDSPTGNMIKSDVFMKCVEIASAKNAFVLIDESFIWFSGKREINENKLIQGYPNVIILRSLTKIFSIPGLRLGYIASSPENIEKLEKIQEPWAVSQVALQYIRGIDTGILSSIPAPVSKERKYMSRKLTEMGFKIIGNPEANYITVNIPDGMDGIKLKKFLEDNNIMVRTLEDYPEFSTDYIRINIKRRVKNDVLINMISKFIEGNL